MCTAATLKTNDFYFGRTLDNEFSYLEEVTITPRNFPFFFRNTAVLNEHYAIIGMAFNRDNFPLYYDASNEKGLSMAGLNFVGNACYNDVTAEKENVAQFELIPYILGKCATVNEAEKLIKSINITNTPFSNDLPTAQLHWLIADENRCITLECTKSGVDIYDNPIGVLTNNPPFYEHMTRINDYKYLSNENPKTKFSGNLELKSYSKGMGAMGLPGDLSSTSRFVRAAFTKCNSVCENGETESVNQFFHILGSVSQTRGCTKTDSGLEITIYTSCCNASKGIYYYNTYENRQITAVNMHNENLDSKELVKYPLILKSEFRKQN